MIEEKLKEIQAWLRMHGDYSIAIELWGLYGCYEAVISHLTQTLHIYRGVSFVHRLDDILEWIHEQQS